MHVDFEQDRPMRDDVRLLGRLLGDTVSAPWPQYLAALEKPSANAFGAYRHLVYETTGFEHYFWESAAKLPNPTSAAGRRPATSRVRSRRCAAIERGTGTSAIVTRARSRPEGLR